MTHWLERTELLLGSEKMKRLQNARVLVVGLGGVGAYAAEMLARSGIGALTIVDADDVSETNINRQLVALHSTVGRPKAEILAARLQDINPQLRLTVLGSMSGTKRPTGCSTEESSITRSMRSIRCRRK